MAKILLVDDDAELRKKLAEWLSSQNYTVDHVQNGEDALQLVQSFTFDLIILDWQMPGISGLEVCRKIRQQDIRTPILFLTGLGDFSSKENGLEIGADDYVVKPFDTRELGARIRALLRRPQSYIQGTPTFGGLSLDTAFNTITVNGQTSKITARECALLEFLMRHPGQPFTARELRDRVWSAEASASEEAVRTCMKTLRQKLKQVGWDAFISRIAGAGYVLKAP